MPSTDVSQRGSSAVVPTMQGGDGEDSYAANSMFQNYGFHAHAKLHLAEALQRFIDLAIRRSPPKYSRRSSSNSTASKHEETAEAAEEERPCMADAQLSIVTDQQQHLRDFDILQVAVADFGCSHGENPLTYASFVVHALTEALHELNQRDNHKVINKKIKHAADPRHHDRMLEIQYFFSDLPSNDFNHLFQSLAVSSNPSPTVSDWPTLPNTKVYAAGMPGSFYDRLFPSGSLNFVISAISLHWLSRIPPEVLDKSSPAWNGEHIWISNHGQRPEVNQAFARQSKADLVRFLKCRAQEMAANAILFLFAIAPTQELPVDDFMSCDLLQATWDAAVDEDLVSCEERDTFNIPAYVFDHKELEAALEDVPELKILKLEVMRDQEQLPKEEVNLLLKDTHAFRKFWVGFVESFTKPMILGHIGLERTTLFFHILEQIVAKKPHLSTQLVYGFQIAICQRC